MTKEAGEKMTNEKISEYKNELGQIVTSFNKSFSGIPDKVLYENRKSTLEQITSLAIKVGASRCIGTGIANLEKSLRESPVDDFKKISGALEAIITEIIVGINIVLQTETMINACVSAEQSSATAKWSCFWAAVAAVAACISVLLVLFCG